MNDYSPRQLVTMMVEAGRNLEEAQTELVNHTHAASRAERRYRQAKATAYIASTGTVGEREALVAKACDEEFYAAHLAEGLVKASLESVRSRRAILSSLQSISASVKAEAELLKYGPESAA
jgi:hypothetical protein